MGTKSKWLKGKLTFHNNAVVEENVGTYTTTDASIPPYGLRVLENTANAKMRLSGGPAIGQEIEIVCNSTFVTVVRVSTDSGVSIAKPAAQVAYGVIVTAAGTSGGNYPGTATLRGVTTSQWAIVKGFSTSFGGCTYSTAIA
jgi:hypothetical protein